MRIAITAVSIFIIASPALAETEPAPIDKIELGSRFTYLDEDKFKPTTRMTHEEMILEKDSSRIKVRVDTGASGVSLHILDARLRIIEAGTSRFSPGNCSGVPTKIEIGSSSTFELSWSTSNGNNAKAEFRAKCISKVTGKETHHFQGEDLEVFVISNEASYKNSNGTAIVFGASGLYAPKLGGFFEKTFIEKMDGTLFRQFKSRLIKYTTD